MSPTNYPNHLQDPNQNLNRTAQNFDGQSGNFQHSSHFNNSQHLPNQSPNHLQPWLYNRTNGPNASSSDTNLRVLDNHHLGGQFSHSDKNHQSIPNLHSFQTSAMANSMGNTRSNVLMGHAPLFQNFASRHDSSIKPISAPQPLAIANPLGFQPSYNPVETSQSRPLVIIPKPRTR